MSKLRPKMASPPGSRRQRWSSQIRDVEAQGETLEQLLHQEVQQLVVVGGAALGQKVVQAVVSR